MKGRKTTKKAQINKVKAIRICDTKGFNFDYMYEFFVRKIREEGTVVRDFRDQPLNAVFCSRNCNWITLK